MSKNDNNTSTTFEINNGGFVRHSLESGNTKPYDLSRMTGQTSESERRKGEKDK